MIGGDNLFQIFLLSVPECIHNSGTYPEIVISDIPLTACTRLIGIQCTNRGLY